MPNPMRIPAGFTQQANFQPLRNFGTPDPVFYADMADDFMFYQAGRYTVTATGNGTVAAANLAGGVVTYTTNSSTPATTDIVSLQLNNAGTTFTAGMKTGFLCRVNLNADATNPAFLAGLIQKTTTPFTVTDGAYILKPSGSTTITAYVVVGSVVKASLAIPAATFAFATTTWVDLALVYEGKDDLLIYAGTGLIGGVPDQNREPFGLVGRISGVASGNMLTAAVLTPTVALQSGTATSKTAGLDFVRALAER